MNFYSCSRIYKTLFICTIKETCFFFTLILIVLRVYISIMMFYLCYIPVHDSEDRRERDAKDVPLCAVHTYVICAQPFRVCLLFRN